MPLNPAKRQTLLALKAGAVTLFAACLPLAPSALAQTPPRYSGPIFDAHLHYNDEAFQAYPSKDVYERMRRAGVRGILANSRPNEGTRTLIADRQAREKAGVTLVPMVRLYRNRADYHGWFADPTIETMVLSKLQQGTAVGPFRGIGGVPVERVNALMAKHPTLMGELSYRPGLTRSDGGLSPEWKELLAHRSDRFLVGSDTWVNTRWSQYEELIADARRWLADLSPSAAHAIAWGNAAKLFGLSAPR